MKAVCHSNNINVVQPSSQKNTLHQLERINNSRVAQPEFTSLEERIYMQWYGHLSLINGSV